VSVALEGPTSLYFSPSSVSAFSPPLSAVVKYGLLTCLGRKPTVRPFLRAAFGSALPAEAAEPLSSLLTSFLVVPPQAVTASAREVAAARAAQARRIDDFDMEGPLVSV
jgi:hypothetical protein